MTASLPGRAALRRPVVADIDLRALRHNVGLLHSLVEPAALAVVVKADAYGHGAVPIARAAAEAGADLLAVALVDEGLELLDAGVRAPILVLAEPAPDAIAEGVAAGLALAVYTEGGVAAAEQAAAASGQRARLHLKVDTGMHRVGADLADAPGLARSIASSPHLLLDGLFTHFAVADQPEDPFTGVQLERFRLLRDALSGEGITARVVHAANSAGAIAHPEARLDLVRVGIAAYGVLPDPRLASRMSGVGELAPVLSLRAEVHQVRRLPAGERTSYGLHYRLERPSTVVTVAIGYADGVPRLLGEAGGAVLIGGRRRPIAGTVTMDQLIVDCGEDETVAPGDEVVLLGRQGEEAIDAWEWAERTGTIAYEVLARLGTRIARRVVG